MKNFSLPRLALVLWFAIFSFLSLVLSYGMGHREISAALAYSVVWTAVFLICLGLIEDKL